MPRLLKGQTMSDQTPDSTQDMADGHEPSMEDILASIRKIIADDDTKTPAPTEAADDTESVFRSVSKMDSELEGDSDLAALDLDLVQDDAAQDVVADNELEALLSDMDSSEPIARDSAVSEAEFDDGVQVDDMLDLEIPYKEAVSEVLKPIGSDFPESLPDLPEVQDAPGAQDLSVAFDDNPDDIDDDLSLMLDDMLVDNTPESEPSSLVELEAAIEPEIEDLVELAEIETPVIEDADLEDLEDILEDVDDDLDVQADFVPNVGADADMDLVKSLMADLTEDPLDDSLYDELTADEALESSEDDAQALQADLDDIDDADSADIMDEILNMTLGDEVSLQEDVSDELAVAAADIEATSAEDEALSLKEIAALAESEADSLDGKGMIAALGVGVAAGGVAAATMDTEVENEDEEDEDVESYLDTSTETPDIEDEIVLETNLTPADPTPEETPVMPRAAKKSDAIIDDVTETATAGAFASLNQAVEEKATIAERGDRIGDLVMESLRPMLKEWLDANLKGIVERAVTKEVKRISSGK